MSRPCAKAMLLAAAATLTACQARSKPWPKAAGTTPYRDEDLGQSLAPAQPPMAAVERGGDTPATASNSAASPATSPRSPGLVAPSSIVPDVGAIPPTPDVGDAISEPLDPDAVIIESP